MKAKYIQRLAVVAAIFCLVSVGLADIRLRFARGRTSATVSGRIARGDRICYIAGARRGQTLTATLSSRSGQVQIFESGDTSYTTYIDYSGDQTICVDNLEGATTYTLTVSIR
jgi:hypothetical protein